MLFRGENNECIKSKTVLMLTHDLDPVIDTVKILKEFNNISESKFITTKKGMLEEIEIKNNDLMTFPQICHKVIKSDANIITKLIYLRRYFEVLDDLKDGYQVLSNLFHKRNETELKDTRKPFGNDLMDNDSYSSGIAEIKNQVDSFDYKQLLESIKNSRYLQELYIGSENNYTKLNIFRLFYDNNLDKIPSVLRKFINETYHIENELICQLNPNKFDLIPDFIIEACDAYVLNDS